MNFDFDETEDVNILTLTLEGAPPGAQFKVGYAPKSRALYLKGDLHPLGEASALLQAAKEYVPYISIGAISALFPEDWLRQACQGDQNRMRIIHAIGQAVRGTA